MNLEEIKDKNSLPLITFKNHSPNQIVSDLLQTENVKAALVVMQKEDGALSAALEGWDSFTLSHLFQVLSEGIEDIE